MNTMMPIHTLQDTHIEQQCVACGRTNTIPLDTLAAGLKHEEEQDPRVIALPPCAGCGAREFLLRSPEAESSHPAPGSFGHRHRLLVDHLHETLVKRGQHVEGMRSDALSRRGPSHDELARWFPAGLRLVPPPRTDGDAARTESP